MFVVWLSGACCCALLGLLPLCDVLWCGVLCCVAFAWLCIVLLCAAV